LAFEVHKFLLKKSSALNRKIFFPFGSKRKKNETSERSRPRLQAFAKRSKHFIKINVEYLETLCRSVRATAGEGACAPTKKESRPTKRETLFDW
jgi:hypothetical protein